jgi:hypothetical protein
MIEFSKPGASGPKRHPVDPLLGPHYAQAQVAPTRAPARGSVIRQQQAAKDTTAQSIASRVATSV